MIRIFNKVSGHEIQIDESFPQVTFTPRDYEDIPFVEIKLKGLDFGRHSETCEDCRSFRSSFGTETTNWFIEYMDKIRRLDLSDFGVEYAKNRLRYISSDLEHGSTLKLNLSLLPTSKEEQRKNLRVDIEAENYERCCMWRDLLKEAD